MAGRHANRDLEPQNDAPRVELLADSDRPGGFMLLLDRVRQSYVDVDDPTYLEFEYVRWMAHGLASLRPGSVAATHIGGGAGTIVRYLSAVRPGSTHIVCEPDTELTALVRSRLPFARSVRARIRPIDGRRGLADLGADSADCVVLDAFSGGRVPADLTTREAAAAIARVLRPGGLLLVNLGDGGGLRYTRRVVAGITAELPHVLVVTDKAVLNARRYGNIVLMAGALPLDLETIRRGLAAEPFPCTTLAGPELANWLGGAASFTDADSARSPEPPEATWRVSLD